MAKLGTGFTTLIFLSTVLLISSKAASNPISLHCQFPVGQVIEFTDSGVKFNKSEKLPDLVFDSIDTGEGTARMLGNAGAETVQVLEGDYVFNFVEITPVGNLSITTVYKLNSDPSDNALRAVHSRHVTVSGKGKPSQYAGRCHTLQ